MDIQPYRQMVNDMGNRIMEALLQTETYTQLAVILVVIGFSYLISVQFRRRVPVFAKMSADAKLSTLRTMTGKLGNLIFPLLTILILSICVEMSPPLLGESWLLHGALVIGMILVLNAIIRDHVRNEFIAFVFRWIGLPLLFLHLANMLVPLIGIFDSVSVKQGNIQISVYDIIRILLFGSVLFWLGRVSASTGKEIIRRQARLDFRTKEVAAKLLEVVIFFLISLLLLQVMGINLTALAVFGGAVGVGLGLGLQAIASNFISGIIILLDRSISEGDYIELEDGRTGVVRELTLRSTMLETFDGKDIMVPNEKFMTESFTNWTHKDMKQRYRVDFSVAYHSDVRKLVEIIKSVVASHEKVLSGEDVPFEERPDCEIDSFGDSGINMFVEFWMYGIDDGKNRVGGDLLLLILEALQEHGFEIPFPQREIRMRGGDMGKNPGRDERMLD